MTRKYVPVDKNNLDRLFDVMGRSPGQVMLAPSMKHFQTGMPVTEMIRPPHRMVMMVAGVALSGTCAVSGGIINLAIDEGGAVMSNAEAEPSPIKGWTHLKKDGLSLRIFIPAP